LLIAEVPVRRTLIQTILPLVFALIPALVGVVVAVAIPPAALHDYLRRIQSSYIDWLILALGAILFVLQTLLGWRALQWQGEAFDERPDRWLSNLAQAAEWFPLMGLLGTVAAILQTFSTITGTVTPQEIISKYAPAITATGSGLFMALLNILPTWVVTVGRDLILALGGGPPSSGATS
jgi:biopolymer transport protein ExbB/TolQ